MSICTAEFTIAGAATTGDFPMDQAVYSATQDKIYGVRGGYIFEFNATTGAIIRSSRYAVPLFSDASIAYDTVNDKIFCSAWRDMAFANGGDTNFEIIVAKKLYRIDPATLTVEASAEINGVGGFPGYISLDQQQMGPHRILYYNGLIYCATYGNTNPKLCTVDPSTLLVVTNGETLHWNYGFWLDFCIQPAGAEPLQVWMVTPDRAVEPCASPALKYSSSNYFAYVATDYAAPYSIIYGVCFNTDTGKMYGVPRSQTVVKWTPDLSGSPFADITFIDTGVANANATPYRIVHNPYDSLIYVPGYSSNNVVVINPTLNDVNPATGITTITGFDSPFDIVFTPTKVWAVQQGLVPLKEVI